MTTAPPAADVLDRPAVAPPSDWVTGLAGPGWPFEPIVLPDHGTGERARRRRARRRLRTHQLLAAGAALLAAVLVGVLGRGHLSTTAAPATRAAANATPPGPVATPVTTAHQTTALLVQRDASGAAVSLTVLALAPSGHGGHVILIPPATMTELPSFGLDGVGKALSLGGPTLLQASVENLFGVDLDQTVVLDDNQLAAMVAPAGGLTVRVRARVEQVDDTGQATLLWPAGTTTLAPTDVPRFLEVHGRGNDLTRLVRHQSFWQAFLARVAADPRSVAAPPGAGGLAQVIDGLAAGRVQVDLLPVEALSGGSTPADEAFRVRQTELESLVASALPTATTVGKEGRTRVQILNGTGAVGQSQQVAVALVRAGARVVLTGNADRFNYKQTQIVFYDRSQQAAATKVQKALGVGRLVLSHDKLDVVDVTVVVGKDFHSG